MISKNEISISTLDGFLRFINLKKAYEFIKATSCIKTEWFEAKIDFEISEERLIEFTEDFNKLNNGDINSVLLINEKGNFELNITLDRSTGKVKLSGVLMRNMVDEDEIKFSVLTDWISISGFSDDIKIFIHKLNN